MAESDYKRVAGFATERLANAAAQELVLKGLGAVVEPRPPEIGSSENPSGPLPAADRFCVMVLPADLERACDILGIVDPQRGANDLNRAKANIPPLRYLVPAILGALVGIPIAAFFITYKLSGG